MSPIEDIAGATQIAWLVLIVGIGILAPTALRYFGVWPSANDGSSWLSTMLFGMLGVIAVCLGLARLL